MPWSERSTMSLREEFVCFAMMEEANIQLLCRRFGISRKTGYKWLSRYTQEGASGLADRPRRPLESPGRTAGTLERAVLAVRDQHPAWGGRKIRHILAKELTQSLPSPSTITAILRRNGRIDPEESAKRGPCQRFEHPEPNAMWQMDFKGSFGLSGAKARCHPLTVIDDHSRFCLLLSACPNEQTETVKQRLVEGFRIFGLPDRMLMDNGPPWGGGGVMKHTPLSAWLMRLGIYVCHGRPWHPQTQGKDERFHRTLMDELLRPEMGLSVRWNVHASSAQKPGAAQSQSGRSVSVSDLGACQTCFDRFREVYNHVRPHESLDMQTPQHRYRPSNKTYPEALPPIEYATEEEQLIRKVATTGKISFGNRRFHIGMAFAGQPIALWPTDQDALYDVFFCSQRVGFIDLRSNESAT